jgi:hypothetical protein
LPSVNRLNSSEFNDGGESVTALAGFTAVLIGRSAGTDGKTDDEASSILRSLLAKLPPKGKELQPVGRSA